MLNNFHKVLSLNYYYNSLKDIERKVTIGNIYIFSDDLNWIRDNFKWECKNNTKITFVSLKTDIDELSRE